MASPEHSVRSRAHRATRACDFCNLRSIRCRPSETSPSSCQSCLEYGRRCAYERPTKKRGVRPTSDAAAQNDHSSSISGKNSSPQLTLPECLTDGVLMQLIFVFFEVVYPAIPCFSRRNLVDRVSRAEYKYDRAFLGMLLALCGLVCAYVRDGATYSGQPSDVHLFTGLDPSHLWLLASNTIPKDPGTSANFDHLRACALLALLSLQNKDVTGMKTFLGIYNMNVQLQGLTEERNWPDDISDGEREERRCLFWSAYMIEMFYVTCLDGVAVSRESHSDVCYPSELGSCRSMTDNSPCTSQHESSENVSSARLISWKFAVHLSRILENAVDYQRSSAKTSSASARVAYYNLTSPPRLILHSLSQRYNALKPHLTSAGRLATDSSMGGKTFMENDIVLTIQLLRVVLLNQQSISTSERLDIGRAALQFFSRIPPGHVKAMGAPFLHKFAFVGSLMVSPKHSLQPVEYQRTMAMLQAFTCMIRAHDPSDLCAGHAGWRLRAVWELKDSAVPAQMPAVVGAPMLAGTLQTYPQNQSKDGICTSSQPSAATEIPFELVQAEMLGAVFPSLQSHPFSEQGAG